MIAWVSKYFSVIKMTWVQTLEYKANAIVGAFAIFSGLLIAMAVSIKWSGLGFALLTLLIVLFLRYRPERLTISI